MTADGARRRRYHAFISFRGDDTRDNFVSHLYDRMTARGIYTFKDDRRLEKGRSISLELRESIRDSALYVVVLSENYASSSWCLDELVEIFDCGRGKRVVVVPVFYKVDPSDVTEQRGSFAEAFRKHEREFGEEKVKKWRKCLTKVANMCGWDSRNRDEAQFIDGIVRDISDKVNCASSIDTGDLVGMGLHAEEMLKLLSVDSGAGRMVGIWGMGGIGKSTIARVVYDRLCSKYGGCCFLSNVGSKFKMHGVAYLREELLRSVLRERDFTGWSLDKDSNVIEERLCRRKVLVVLDDVDHLEQLQVLAKDISWFGPGSRVIITTRERHLLVSHGVNFIYETKPLETDTALQLFSRFAFKQNQPCDDYLELSHDFLSCAGRIPLALKVLGSSLFNRTVSEWKRELTKLRRIPDWEILKVLKVSYDGLDDMERDVFLDIACFFNGMNKDKVRDILDGCGFFTERAFGLLMDKSLLSISNNNLYMHKLLQELGQEIVRREFKEPGQRTRWWDQNDIYDCLTKNMGTEKVEGIFLDMSESREMHLGYSAFDKMSSLRLLKFHAPQSIEHVHNVKLLGTNLNCLSNRLRYLHWDSFPAKELPFDFCAEFLVELHLPYSNVELLWKGKQRLANLKLVDASHSDLTRVPDLSKAQNLKSLNLKNCKRLVDVSSIGYLSKLECLNLSGCTNLVSIPSMEGLELLITVDLSYCSKFRKLHQLSRSTKYMYLAGTAIEELPPSIEFLSCLLVLDLRNCKRLKNLQNSPKLKSLRNLDVAGCFSLLETPSQNQHRELETTCSEHPSLYLPDGKSHDYFADGTLTRYIKLLNFLYFPWSKNGKESPLLSPLLTTNLWMSRLTNESLCTAADDQLFTEQQDNSKPWSKTLESREDENEKNEESGQTQPENMEERKRKRPSLRNGCNYSEDQPSFELQAADIYVEKTVTWKDISVTPDVSRVVSACLLPVNGAIECAQSLQAVVAVKPFKPAGHLEQLPRSILSDGRVINGSPGRVHGGRTVIDRLEGGTCNRELCSKTVSSCIPQSAKQSLLQAFGSLRHMLEQGPQNVGQHLGTLKSTLQFLKKLTLEDCIPSEAKARLSNIEKKISVIVGQVISSNYGKKEIESKIQTFNQRSEKCRSLTAAMEKANHDMKSATSEVNGLRSQMAKLKQQLASAEKRQSDANERRDSLTTELLPLHLELRDMRDDNLEVQEMMIKESELATLRSWKELEALTFQGAKLGAK